MTALLHALGLSSEEILAEFYSTVAYTRGPKGWQIPFVSEQWRGQKPMYDVINADTGEVMFKSGEKITPRKATQAAKDGLKHLLIPTEETYGRYSAFDLVNDKTGEIYIEAGDEVGPENLAKIDAAKINKLELLDIDYVNTGPWIRNTLKADKAEDADQALSDIYRVMRPGEPPTRETADALFYGLFFDAERYDLSAVGRVKLNMRLGLDVEDTVTTLRREDILAVVKELVNLKDGKGDIDDIDISPTPRALVVSYREQYRVGMLEWRARQGACRASTCDGPPNDLSRQASGCCGARILRLVTDLAFRASQPAVGSHPQAPLSAWAGGLTRERRLRGVTFTRPLRQDCPIETTEGRHRSDHSSPRHRVNK